MDKKSTLDFLVIGAMRSGTTTLYELLKQHPQLLIPPGKEVPFFSDDAYFKRGMKWYLEKNFDTKQHKKLWGTVTPQYMFTGIPTEKIAKRIYQAFPDIKLIAILRHPIERSISHYKYATRHGYESRSFDKAVQHILAQDDTTLLQNRKPDEIYLLRSQYGKCLAPYYELFNKNQILIIYTDELAANPKNSLTKIYNFLKINSDYFPKNYSAVVHKGGTKPKIPLLTPGAIGRIKILRKLWRLVVPYRMRKRFEIWLHVWNTKTDDSEKIELPKAIYDELVSYFNADIKLLKTITKSSPPWKDWQ